MRGTRGITPVRGRVERLLLVEMVVFCRYLSGGRGLWGLMAYYHWRYDGHDTQGMLEKEFKSSMK